MDKPTWLRVLSWLLLGIILSVVIHMLLVQSTSTGLQVLGYLLLSGLSFYVPLQAYGRRIRHNLGWPASGKKQWMSIAIAYLVWYPPPFIFLSMVWLSEQYSIRFEATWLIAGLLWSVLSHFFLELQAKKSI